MEFPKQIMKLSELVEMGFPEDFLRYAYGSPQQNFATKQNPTKKNSPILFDTAGFKVWWDRQIKAQVQAMPRR